MPLSLFGDKLAIIHVFKKMEYIACRRIESSVLKRNGIL